MEVSLSVTFKNKELYIISTALEVYADLLEKAVAEAPPLPNGNHYPNMYDTERAYIYEHARTLKERIDAVVEANGI